MNRESGTAELWINGTNVGQVDVHGWRYSWGFGDFRPNAEFRRYAPLFMRWAKLMDTGPAGDRIGEAPGEHVRDDLREVEYAIDRLHFSLHVPDGGRWRAIAELAIDGPMIEWREWDGGLDGEPAAAERALGVG